MTRVFRPDSANRLTLPLLMLVATFSIPHVSSMSPFITEMAEEFDVSEGLAGQLGSVSFAGAFVIAVVLTPFVDNLSLRRLLAASLIIVGISTFFTAIIPSFWGVMVTRLFAGFGGGIIGASVLGSVPRAWPDPTTRVKRVGLVVASFAGGPGLWAPGVRLVADETSWQTAVGLYAVASTLIGLLIWGMLPDLIGTARTSIALGNRIGTATRLLWYPVLGQVYLARGLMVATFGAVIGFIAAFSEHFYPGADSWIGPIIASTALGFMVSALASGLVINRLGGPARSALYFTVASAIATAVLIWMTTDPFVTVIGMFAWGACAAIVMSATQELLFAHSGDQQVSAVFLSGAVAPIGHVGGVVIGGVAFDAAADLSVFQWYISILGAAALIPMLMVIKQIRDQASVADSQAPEPAD